MSRSGSTVTNSTWTFSASGPRRRIASASVASVVGQTSGALRVAEEEHHHLAAKIGERARLAGVVGEREIAAERSSR